MVLFKRKLYARFSRDFGQKEQVFSPALDKNPMEGHKEVYFQKDGYYEG